MLGALESAYGEGQWRVDMGDFGDVGFYSVFAVEMKEYPILFNREMKSKPIRMWSLTVLTSEGVSLPARVLSLRDGFIEWHLGYFRTKKRALEFFRAFKESHCAWLSMSDADIEKIEI